MSFVLWMNPWMRAGASSGVAYVTDFMRTELCMEEFLGSEATTL